MWQNEDRNDPQPTHYCPQCGTQYFAEQECDWCPDVRAIPLPIEEERKAA